MHRVADDRTKRVHLVRTQPNGALAPVAVALLADDVRKAETNAADGRGRAHYPQTTATIVFTSSVGSTPVRSLRSMSHFLQTMFEMLRPML